jgi:hypothetical protein
LQFGPSYEKSQFILPISAFFRDDTDILGKQIFKILISKSTSRDELSLGIFVKHFISGIY